MGITVDDALRTMVNVKYEEHDDPEWQYLSHMKSELDPKMFKKFLEPLQSMK